MAIVERSRAASLFPRYRRPSSFLSSRFRRRQREGIGRRFCPLLRICRGRAVRWSRFAALCLAALAFGTNESPDALLKAMKDEIERSRTLEFSGLDKPYFIEYTVEDLHSVS